MPGTVPEIIKMFYNCAGERQTFACRILTPINAGLPHLARVCRYRARVHRLPACCCRLVAWHGAELERDGIRKASLHYGTADRRYGNGRPTLWDGRPTLWDGRPTLWDDRPALRDAIGRHGTLWDGIPMLWDGIPTLWDGISDSLPHASEGLPPSNAN